jgi:hypothetical protein
MNAGMAEQYLKAAERVARTVVPVDRLGDGTGKLDYLAGVG